jgi:hypothetical protein
MEPRRLYPSEPCSWLYRYCIDRLGNEKDAALNRHPEAFGASARHYVEEKIRERARAS